ncbi:ROK family transcriptional regulator [Arthrobacter castelli]|uniref:ROK family transcriptional regulator n=1 Tax=Arthrobacter castelli TaxID=271431 RepID=UPI000428D43D|nr:ROK family transcriptional regulator [Arthrobacter castelli]
MIQSQEVPGQDAAFVSARVTRTGEVLDLVRSGLTTISALAARLQVSRSTVTERVDLLIKHGLLRTDGEALAGRGRPATSFVFNPASHVILTAQLGIQGTRIAVTDLAGTVLRGRTMKLDLSVGPEVGLDFLLAEFRALLDEADRSIHQIHGIGIGIPGIVELEMIKDQSTEEFGLWIDYPVARQTSEAFGAPVYLDHDVNLLALGEHAAHWSDAGVFLCIKVGTAIGCGIVINGQVIRGGAGHSGEIGHTKVANRDAQCACGNVGCLNVAASGRALVDTLTDAGEVVSTADEVVALARAGNVKANQAIRGSGRDIGDVLAGIVNLLSPDVVTFWGHLAELPEQFLTGVRESVYRGAVPAVTRTLTLEKARLGEDSGMRGAALLVTSQTLRPEAVDRYMAVHG